jgi:hypothetical protein
VASDPRRLRFDPTWRCVFHDRRVWRVSAKTGRRYPGCDQCHAFARLTVTMAELGFRPVLAALDDLPF